MNNWTKTQIYCQNCSSWHTNIKHRSCPKSGWFRGEAGLTWINVESHQMGCDKCTTIWPLEESVYYCSCGHVQYTYYTDSAVVIEATDQIVATDGDLVYVLKKSGAVVVGCRTFHDFRY